MKWCMIMCEIFQNKKLKDHHIVLWHFENWKKKYRKGNYFCTNLHAWVHKQCNLTDHAGDISHWRQQQLLPPVGNNYDRSSTLKKYEPSLYWSTHHYFHTFCVFSFVSWNKKISASELESLSLFPEFSTFSLKFRDNIMLPNNQEKRQSLEIFIFCTLQKNDYFREQNA